MRAHQTHQRTALRWALPGAVLIAVLGLSCDNTGGDLAPPDFFLTIKLHTDFLPQAVGRLEVVISDTTMLLADSGGESSDGGISWETREGIAGDEFVVNLTGDYFREHAQEVGADTWEIDIPFIGGQEEGGFNVRATVYWTDPNGLEHDIGYGIGNLTLPLEHRGDVLAIEVMCNTLPPPGWAWTCRTGCASNVQQCTTDIAVCGSGPHECVDGCCTPL